MINNTNLLNLSGKSAIVTGAGKGIGAGIAYRLAEAGANVLIADIDAESAHTEAKKLQAEGWRAEATTVDVSNADDIQAMIATCVVKFGAVDILVNNAGIFPPASITDMEEADFEKVIQVNLHSVFLATKYVSQVMRKQGGGKIINITSIDALHPSMIGLSHYDASKHGVWGFTKNSALELAKDNIWVNAIAPGGIATPGVASMSIDVPSEQMSATTAAFLAKIPMHRMGEPDEIGKAVLFLASDMSSYMTGSQIVIDGGALLS